MKLIIKNMVCQRCILVVRNVLENLSLNASHVSLGTVELTGQLTKQQHETFASALSKVGLELLDDEKSQLVEQIKQLCIQYLNEKTFLQDIGLSTFLSQQLDRDYRYLSRLFSATECCSIEQYYLNIRLEKIKELISYKRMSFSEIAFDLGFSSVPHLSKQFKQLTGLTLSQFKDEMGPEQRRSLDDV